LRILVTGAGGQLGRELVRVLYDRGYQVVPLLRKDLDITDAESVRQAVDECRPDLLINAAAHSGVDACETELDLAYRINALGPRNLAVSCEQFGCELLHVSTNYVFDGTKDRPYEPFDAPNPINAYGRTKLAGEEYVKHLCSRWYIVRTAGLYGEGENFVRTMLRLSESQKVLKVKDDEFISPTYARDLAGAIAEIMESKLYGIYHTTNSGSCSWYELAQEIFQITGLEVALEPVPSSEYPTYAERPANGVLSGLGSPSFRHWRDALADYLKSELPTSLQ
jgi:dTDP-4-dehydrorhamnose reductase